MKRIIISLVFLSLFSSSSFGQESVDSKPLPVSSDFYKISTIPVPESIVLEVGGLAFMPDGKLAASTRRGEVWLISNPEMKGGSLPRFKKFASGLHEALGLSYRNNSLYVTHRPEVMRLQDKDGDGSADVYESIYSWPLDGNYHNYSYGPVFSPEGNMMVQLNLAWVGYGASLSKWRGWTLEITPEGEMTPIATGMRSPSSLGYNMEGDLFYSENQGDWVGSGFIAHVEKGDFLGNPGGLKWTGEPDSPLRLRPEDVPDTGEPKHEVAKRIPALKTPAVWFPHGLMGISTSDILPDSTGGLFGPFAGQLFVGDQGHSKIFRVDLEKVDGVYQGSVFPFLEGFRSGVLRLAWSKSGTLFVGQTSRGWDATGKNPFGLQKVNWTGKVPFEIQHIKANSDGFTLHFTKAANQKSAEDPSSYSIEGFTYHYHSKYGSDVIMAETAAVRSADLSEDGLSVRLFVDNLREGYIHEIKAEGLRSVDSNPLLNDVGYYTLNRIPQGPKISIDRYRGQATPKETSVESFINTPLVGKRIIDEPSSWKGKVDFRLSLGTVPGLRFDKEEFTVKAGSKVKLSFDNNDDMMHNIVIVNPGGANDAGKAALELGLKGHEMGYVPDSPSVLFHSSLLEPESSESIYFVAPTVPGDYEFVCTFPGHAFTMRGILKVVK